MIFFIEIPFSVKELRFRSVSGVNEGHDYGKLRLAQLPMHPRKDIGFPLLLV